MSENIMAITGPTSGIGRATALELANQFDRIVLLVSNLNKGEVLKQEMETNSSVQIDVIRCDLSELSSIEAAVNKMKEKYDSIDCLILNAGVVSLTKQKTKNGCEMMTCKNNIGQDCQIG